MNELEKKRRDALLIIHALNGHKFVEVFLNDEDGSGFIDIDGVCFNFGTDKKIKETCIPL